MVTYLESIIFGAARKQFIFGGEFFNNILHELDSKYY